VSAALARDVLLVRACFHFPLCGTVTMFGFYSNQLGCHGSIAVSIILSVLLLVVIRSCNG
jgi:hypothetical protein